MSFEVLVSEGDLVTNDGDSDDLLYYENVRMDPDCDEGFKWDGSAALVVRVMKCSPWPKVQLFVGGKLGWTYADYVCLVR